MLTIRIGLFGYIVFNVLVYSLVLLYTFKFIGNYRPPRRLNAVDYDADQIVDFEGFDNTNATENHTMIVPNIVHLIYMDKNTLRFHEMLCLFSIYLNQRPDTIIIHCENCTFHGYYWQEVEKVHALRKLIRFSQLPVSRTIFGKISEWPVHHRGDYWRNLILMEYGGMYLDNDVYVVNSLNFYRKFEMSVGWEDPETYIMGSQVLLAHKNARFLRSWFDSYRTNYNHTSWYYNAGILPGQILKDYPFLAHQEPFRFGVFFGTTSLYVESIEGWNISFDTWHLLINHRHYVDKANYALYPEFDEENVWVHNVTFCLMARDVLLRMRLERPHTISGR